MLNDYFCSVFNADDGILPCFARRVSENVCCDDINITPDRILKYIKCKKTYQFTTPCNSDQFTHPKQQKSFY